MKTKSYFMMENLFQLQYERKVMFFFILYIMKFILRMTANQ